MTFFRSLSAAGFLATAVSYGPARMGFGLFVPEFRAAFGLSSSMVGVISSLGFSGFFIGLLIAQFLLNRRGPEVPVLLGLGAATVGMALVATAPGARVLALGVFTAALSAGFAWTPFNDAVHRKVRNVDRPTALSEISTGTSIGIIVAGAVALLMVWYGADWRLCWAVFTAMGAVAFLGNWLALRHVEKAPDAAPDKGWRDLLHITAVPLFGVAFTFGVTSSIFIAFAADRFAQVGLSGVQAGAIPALMFISYGAFGLAGLATHGVRNRVGLAWLLRCLLAVSGASLVLVALVPGTLAGLIGAAGLQGLSLMMMSAVLAFWSERLFPAFPALGFTTTLLATASGSVMGPAVAGAALDAGGPALMFSVAAAIPLVGAVVLRARFVVEWAAGLGPNEGFE